MDIQYIAGFGPIGPDAGQTFRFWSEDLGIAFDELAPDYHHAHDLAGAKVFGLWPLAQAAEATFGTTRWPSEHPVPQAWIEMEMASPEAVGAGLEELRGRGHRILVEAHTEPWGQTTGRLLSPEGMLLGLSYMPAFHDDGTETAGTADDGTGAANTAPARQRIPMRPAYEDAIRAGAKLQTIRIDGPFATGPSEIVLEHEDAPHTAIPVEVTSVRRTTVAELTDADAQADGYPDLPSFLAALRSHVPDLADDATLDVVAYRLAEPERA